MPGNDERDPLDNWLDQQVRPLPPPPGTFEMISRRARRRKARKLAVTVVSAAAVAAAVAVAVPGVTALHLGPSGESGTTVADGSAKSTAGGVNNGTSRLNGGGTPAVSPSPATSAPSPRTNSGPAAGPVPASFAPTSVTFVSRTRAWVIGQAGTPGKCYNGTICTSVAWTSDGGSTWHGEHAPVTGAASGPTGVSGIRFLDGVNGWAFGPELWATHDSGNTWQRIGTNGLRVTDLETAGDQAYALFAQCSGTSATGFAADCTSYTLMTTTATSDHWVPVGGATSGLTRGGGTASAMLALTGTRGYLIAPDGTVYSGPLGGTWSRAGTAPCQPSFPPRADGLPSSGMIALTSATSLSIACYGGPSPSSPVAVYTSGDGAATWSQQSSTTGSGLSIPEQSMTSLAAAPDGTLVLATTHGAYVLPAGNSRWQAVSAAGAGVPGSGLPADGFSYVGMTSDSNGVALPADSSLDEIWLTTDGGLTWTPSRITG